MSWRQWLILGGSILTGVDGNPLAVLARQQRILLHAINSEGLPLYCSNGKAANRRLDQQVWQRRLKTRTCRLMNTFEGIHPDCSNGKEAAPWTSKCGTALSMCHPAIAWSCCTICEQSSCDCCVKPMPGAFVVAVSPKS